MPRKHHADYRDWDNWGTTKPEAYIEWSIAIVKEIKQLYYTNVAFLTTMFKTT